ncbi:MAG: Hsp33 family molecular chaperone HslO [Candidatus Paracaedibacteraceae bacterium]|nr:Hsp33 family molecular chaperone HslO [Candidatus Paracaedibacteraceae bacterium]
MTNSINTQLSNGYIIPFVLDGGMVRGRLVRLGSAFSDITKKHQYPPIVNHYIGEMLSLGAALIMDMKAEGIITLQVTKGSVIRMIVADITSDGNVRACATWDDEALNTLLQKTPKPSLAQLFAGGNLMFTVSLKHQKEDYQAIVELNGATLADCMHHYFRQSEQVPTGLFICTDFSTLPVQSEIETFQAGALIIQRTPIDPESDSETLAEIDDSWFTDISLLATITPHELLSCDISAEMLLYRLFHERDLHLSVPKAIQAKCRCSEERIRDMLVNFSKDDLDAILIDENVTVTCDFCSTNYVFSEDEIRQAASKRKSI